MVLEAFDEELVVVAVAAVGETCEGVNERERTAGKGLSLKSKIAVQLSGKGLSLKSKIVVQLSGKGLSLKSKIVVQLSGNGLSLKTNLLFISVMSSL